MQKVFVEKIEKRRDQLQLYLNTLFECEETFHNQVI